MNDAPYSRELMDAKLDNILLRIDEVKTIAMATHDQAKRTNGRVTKLEGWRSWIMGSVAVLGVASGLVAYIYLMQVGGIRSDLDQHITQSSQMGGR